MQTLEQETCISGRIILKLSTMMLNILEVFARSQKLHQIVHKEGKYKLGMYKIRKWLQSQKPYSLQRGVRDIDSGEIE